MVERLCVELIVEAVERLSAELIVEGVKSLDASTFSVKKLAVEYGSGELDGFASALVYTLSAIDSAMVSARMQLIMVATFICFCMKMISFRRACLT